jgi:hypothetical protein
VLPEGSTVENVKAPFFVEESADTKYTYLDTDGRPVVVISKKNVVFDHNVAFVVEYTFSKINLVWGTVTACEISTFRILRWTTEIREPTSRADHGRRAIWHDP